MGWRRKTVYFFAAAAVVIAIGRGGRAIFGHPGFFGLVYGVLILAATLYGARVFRTPTEPRLPARPLWQMTDTAFLSRRLSLFLFFQVGSLLSTLVAAFFGARFGTGNPPVSSPSDDATLLALGVLLALLYRNSGRRLAQREAS